MPDCQALHAGPPPDLGVVLFAHSTRHACWQVPKMLGTLHHDWCPRAMVVSFKLETEEHLLVKKVRKWACIKRLGGSSCLLPVPRGLPCCWCRSIARRHALVHAGPRGHPAARRAAGCGQHAAHAQGPGVPGERSGGRCVSGLFRGKRGHPAAADRPCCMHHHIPPWRAAQGGEARVQLIERPADVPEIERLLVAEVVAAHQRHLGAAAAAVAGG